MSAPGPPRGFLFCFDKHAKSFDERFGRSIFCPHIWLKFTNMKRKTLSYKLEYIISKGSIILVSELYSGLKTYKFTSYTNEGVTGFQQDVDSISTFINNLYDFIS